MSKLEITVHDDTLRIGEVAVTFQRTLRIPDDGGRYPLPPGLGAFPLRRVADYAGRVPEGWRAHGGVFLPMYQREAMWLRFDAPAHAPRAVKVGVGKVCALTGAPWREGLHDDPQDYLVTPPQPWLDGIASGRGFIRQFVAMPLGLGYTVEGQVTGEERHGGLQLQVFDPKPGRFPDRPPRSDARLCCAASAGAVFGAPPAARRKRAGAMGLAAGGQMRQKLYPDPHGLGTWDGWRTGRVFVHLVDSLLWREITGEAPPPTPVTAKAYARAGLPWYDLYDEGMGTLDPTDTLAGVKSVAELDGEKSEAPLQDDDPVPTKVKTLLMKMAGTLPVKDGDW